MQYLEKLLHVEQLKKAELQNKVMDIIGASRVAD